MCFICGQPNFIRCNCVSAQPFCDQCNEEGVCLDKLDSSCVIYHFGNPALPSRLTCLGMPNGSSAEQIFERIDQLVCSSFNYPITPVQTKTVHLIVSGIANHTLEADVNVSLAVGNKIQILNDGLYVASSGETFKVKVDADAPPRYLADAVVGGTDGCVSITASDESGILLLTPSISYECLLLNICSDPSLSNELASCVVSNICGTGLIDTLDECIVSSLCANTPILTDLATCLLSTGVFSTGSTAVTASNGLHINPASNVKLGGTLGETTTVDQAGFQMNWENGSFQIGDTNAAVPAGVLFQVIDTAGGYSSMANFRKFGQLDPAGSNVASENFLIFHQTGSYTGTLLGSHQDAVDAQLWIDSNFALNLQTSAQTSYAGIYAAMIKSGSGNASGNILTAGYFGGYLADSGNISDMAAILARGPQDPPPAFGGNFTGTVTNYYDIYLADTSAVYGGATITNRFAIFQQGVNDISRFFGPVQNASSSVQFTSDNRVKENITAYAPGLAEIEQIQTHEFNYTYNKEKRVVGVIAQELEAILPAAVEQGNFDTPDGTHYSDFRMVDQTKLFYAMLNAIKELSAKVKALEAK